MTTYQKLDLTGFVPKGTRVREQTIPLSNVTPLGAQILEQTPDRLVIRTPKEGGGVIITGLPGCVGNVNWGAANWLGFDIYYPQAEQFALALTLGLYKDGQELEQEMPHYSVITGVFPFFPTRISLGFSELSCHNGFLPRTPGKLKTVCAGRPLLPSEVCGLYLGTRECHVEQVIEIRSMFLSDVEPDYPMPQVKMVDELGQWTQKDWDGKTKSCSEMVQCLVNELDSNNCKPMNNRSRWGGLLDNRLTSGTGYFSTHRDVAGKWWFVDPDGYAYLVMGIDGVAPTSSSVVDEWWHTFEWLPSKDGEFAAAWGIATGDPNKGRRIERIETFDFIKANLIRAFGCNWGDAWLELTEKRLKSWGINNIGAFGSLVSGSVDFYKTYDMPRFYFMGLGRGGYPSTKATIFRDFPDVFSPEYAENSCCFAKELSEISGISKYVGYFMTNEPEWSFIIDLEIAEMLLQHPKPLYSKHKFIEFIIERYCTLAAFNAAWEQSFTSFNQILQPITNACKINPTVAADLNEFSAIMIAEYVRIPAQACRAVDPHHLNLGLRYPYICYPNQTAGWQYLDVFDINDYRYDPKPYLEWLSTLVDIPVMVSEFHHGALDRGLPVTGIRGVRTQEERGIAYQFYMEQAASCANFLGSVYFILHDQPVLCNSGQENYNIGFVDICNKPHDEIVQYLRKTAENIYQVHAGVQLAFDRHPDVIPLNAC